MIGIVSGSFSPLGTGSGAGVSDSPVAGSVLGSSAESSGAGSSGCSVSGAGSGCGADSGSPVTGSVFGSSAGSSGCSVSGASSGSPVAGSVLGPSAGSSGAGSSGCSVSGADCRVPTRYGFGFGVFRGVFGRRLFRLLRFRGRFRLRAGSGSPVTGSVLGPSTGSSGAGSSGCSVSGAGSGAAFPVRPLLRFWGLRRGLRAQALPAAPFPGQAPARGVSGSPVTSVLGPSAGSSGAGSSGCSVSGAGSGCGTGSGSPVTGSVLGLPRGLRAQALPAAPFPGQAPARAFPVRPLRIRF